MPRVFLLIAQILGLFPVKGLWRYSSAFDFKVKRCSFPMLYSWITLLGRAVVKLFFTLTASAWTIPSADTDIYVANGAYCFTFCTGMVFQMISMLKSKQFVSLLQQLQKYDGIYPPPTETKILSPFLIFHIIFLIYTIGFPTTLFGYGLLALTVKGNSKFIFDWAYQFPYKYKFTDFQEVVTFLGSIAVILSSELALFFVIIQLSYLVRGMEQRLEEIVTKIENYLEISSHSIPMLSKGKWTEATGKCPIDLQPKNFWKDISQRYLDYSELFCCFSKATGLYFAVMYPLEIVSSVFIVYMVLETNILVNSLSPWITLSFKALIPIVALCLWSLCNLGHKLYEIRERLLRNILAANVGHMGSYDKSQYDRCLQIVVSIPFQLSGSGIFYVQRSNIPGIITAVVSYIVVIIQFRISNQSGTEKVVTTPMPPSSSPK